MVAIVSLLVVLVLSLLVVRVATVALSLTGLSRELARFQARSAFTGSGFTTAESEKVVQHPVRRRIIMLLMLLGNAGFITAISSLILTFVRRSEEATPWSFALGPSFWVSRRYGTSPIARGSIASCRASFGGRFGVGQAWRCATTLVSCTSRATIR